MLIIYTYVRKRFVRKRNVGTAGAGDLRDTGTTMPGTETD